MLYTKDEKGDLFQAVKISKRLKTTSDLPFWIEGIADFSPTMKQKLSSKREFVRDLEKLSDLLGRIIED